MLPVALARHRNIALGVKKMSELARLVRGLSCEESIIQMSLSDKKHSVFVKKCIQNAVNNAVNNLGLDAHRLVVKEVLVSKGIVKKKIRYHGKGRLFAQAVLERLTSDCGRRSLFYSEEEALPSHRQGI